MCEVPNDSTVVVKSRSRVDWAWEAKNIPTQELIGLFLNPVFFGKRWARYLATYGLQIASESEDFYIAVEAELRGRPDGNPYLFDREYFK